ncbi:DUF5723 family protein [Limibacter armeniacum]|uniref:DUF5723 family protein n=1 Tax=Limibacter armeniacum TaxID=466084 RepID=UPI002FE66590
MRFLLLIMLWTGLLGELCAQVEKSIYFLNNLPQNSYLNPAKRSDYNFTVSVPVLGFRGGYAGDVALSNFIQEKEGGGYLISFPYIYNEMDEKVSFRTNMQMELLGLYLTKDKFSINFFVREHLNNQFTLPRDIFAIMAQEEAYDKIKEGLHVTPGIQMSHFREFGLGGSYSVTEKLNVGANIRIMQGLGSITTEALDIIAHIDNLDEIEVEYEGYVQTAGFGLIAGEDDLFDISDENLPEYLTSTSNLSLIMDFGATYQFSDKLQFEASLLNLGALKWKNDLTNYRLYQPEGNSDITQAEFEETEEGITPFETSLPFRMNLGASYELWQNTTVGGLVGFNTFQGGTKMFLMGSIDKQFGEWLGLGFTYIADESGGINFGGSVSVGFPGVKLFVVTDHLFQSFTNFTTYEGVKDVRGLDARFGVNLSFGKRNKKNNKSLVESASYHVNPSK